MKSRTQEPSSPQAEHQDNTMVIKPETLGEELYLVHLRRHEGEEVRPEDFDFSEGNSNKSTNKKRSSSVGEELWNVHVKRSRGMEPDTDTDHNEEDEERGQETLKEPAASASPGRYNLRTRRSKNNTSQ